MLSIDIQSILRAIQLTDDAVSDMAQIHSALSLGSIFSTISTEPGFQALTTGHHNALSGPIGSATEVSKQIFSLIDWLHSNTREMYGAITAQDIVNSVVLQNQFPASSTSYVFPIQPVTHFSAFDFPLPVPTAISDYNTILAQLASPPPDSSDSWHRLSATMHAVADTLSDAHSEITHNTGESISAAAQAINKVATTTRTFAANATIMATHAAQLPHIHHTATTTLAGIKASAESAIASAPTPEAKASAVAAAHAETAAFMHGPYQAMLTTAIPPIRNLTHSTSHPTLSVGAISAPSAIPAVANSAKNYSPLAAPASAAGHSSQGRSLGEAHTARTAEPMSAQPATTAESASQSASTLGHAQTPPTNQGNPATLAPAGNAAHSGTQPGTLTQAPRPGAIGAPAGSQQTTPGTSPSAMTMNRPGGLAPHMNGGAGTGTGKGSGSGTQLGTGSNLLGRAGGGNGAQRGFTNSENPSHAGRISASAPKHGLANLNSGNNENAGRISGRGGRMDFGSASRGDNGDYHGRRFGAPSSDFGKNPMHAGGGHMNGNQAGGLHSGGNQTGRFGSDRLINSESSPHSDSSRSAIHAESNRGAARALQPAGSAGVHSENTRAMVPVGGGARGGDRRTHAESTMPIVRSAYENKLNLKQLKGSPILTTPTTITATLRNE